MNTRRSLVLPLFCLALLVLQAPPAAAQRRFVHHHHRAVHGPSPLQLVLEAGAALPQGDLGDDFVGTARGVAAATGYELGVRLRYWLGPQTAVAPAFHYADFADWEDVDAGGVPYAVRAAIWRYGVDVQQFFGSGGRRSVRPYVTVGVAFCHNRYEDWILEEGTYETSANNLAFGLGGGVAMGPIELSAVWTYNPVQDLPAAPQAADDTADWSWLAVRAGVAF